MAYYNLSQVKAILGEIKALNLERLSSLEEADITELQRQFNGAGSDSMPLVLRKALSKLLRLKCTVAIHDWDYFKSDGTVQGQESADLRFFANGHREIYARLSWWNPLRYWSLYKLSVAFKLLQQYGNEAYLKAYKAFNNGQLKMDN